jgi:hypothetical protein
LLNYFLAASPPPLLPFPRNCTLVLIYLCILRAKLTKERNEWRHQLICAGKRDRLNQAFGAIHEKNTFFSANSVTNESDIPILKTYITIVETVNAEVTVDRNKKN